MDKLQLRFTKSEAEALISYIEQAWEHETSPARRAAQRKVADWVQYRVSKYWPDTD